jgi:hypothetical protein
MIGQLHSSQKSVPATSVGTAAVPPAPPSTAPGRAAPKSKDAGVQSTGSKFTNAAVNPYSTVPKAQQASQPADKAPTSKSGVKREGASLAGECSMKHERSSQVRTSHGQGKSADTLKKGMEGGKKLVEKKASVEVKKEAKVGFNETLATTRIGTLTHEGKLSASATAKAEGKFKVTSKGLEVSAGVDAELKAGGEYTLKFKSKEFTIQGEKMRLDFQLDLSAAAVLKANGKVEVAVAGGPPPQAIVKLGGELFAGVQAGAELTGSLTWIKGKGNEVSLIKGTAGVEGRAGAGISGSLDIGYSEGKIHLDAGAGVTLGLGGSFHVKAEGNVKELGEFIEKVGPDGVKDLALQAARNAVAGAAKGALDLIKKPAELPFTLVKKLAGEGVNIPKVSKEVAQELIQSARKGKKVTYADLMQMYKARTGNESTLLNVARAVVAPGLLPF